VVSNSRRNSGLRRLSLALAGFRIALFEPLREQRTGVD
jgi:hypothetical protein